MPDRRGDSTAIAGRATPLQLPARATERLVGGRLLSSQGRRPPISELEALGLDLRRDLLGGAEDALGSSQGSGDAALEGGVEVSANGGQLGLGRAREARSLGDRFEVAVADAFACAELGAGQGLLALLEAAGDRALRGQSLAGPRPAEQLVDLGADRLGFENQRLGFGERFGHELAPAGGLLAQHVSEALFVVRLRDSLSFGAQEIVPGRGAVSDLRERDAEHGVGDVDDGLRRVDRDAGALGGWTLGDGFAHGVGDLVPALLLCSLDASPEARAEVRADRVGDARGEQHHGKATAGDEPAACRSVDHGTRPASRK